MHKAMIWLIMLYLVLCTSGLCAEEVVVYTSLDFMYSKPILEDFEKETGITVKPVYDTEATKTVGLVNRIIAEKDNPQCDVFWNSEVLRTIVLKRKDILQSYVSPNASDISATFKDSDGYWTGFAARARCLVYNKDLMAKEDLPASIFDLTAAEWKGRFTLAYPLFGTTSTHAAALFAILGEENAKAYFKGLKDNDVIIVDGNSTSRDVVARGEVEFGFTDTDDVTSGIERGDPIGLYFPDQNDFGTLLIPNTVCLIKNCPNGEAGRKLIDYLLSKDVESKLAFLPGAQIPLRPGVSKPDIVADVERLNFTKVDFETVADNLESSAEFLKTVFVR